MLIPMIMGKFQMQTSKQINIINNIPENKNWQHDYNDHVIRNNAEYQRIKHYIKNNPLNYKNNFSIHTSYFVVFLPYFCLKK